MVVQSTTAALSARGYLLGPSDYKYIPPQFAYESDGTVYAGTIRHMMSPQYNKNVAQTYFPEFNTFNGIDMASSLTTTSNVDYITWTHTFAFPEARDITHTSFFNINVTDWYYDGFHYPGDPRYRMYYSRDAVNGIGGTWTEKAVVTNEYRNTAVKERRNTLNAISGLTGIWAVKVTCQWGYNWYFSGGGTAGIRHYLHFHGTKSNTQRLAIWKADVDEEIDVGYLDWGTYPQGTAYKYFRVKNLGAQTALANTLTTDAPEHTMSIGGGAYATGLNLGNIAPNGVTAVITLKRESPNQYPPLIPFQTSRRLIVTPSRWI